MHRNPKLYTLGSAQLAAVVAFAACLAVVLFFLLDRPIGEADCEHHYIPSVADRFGFRPGRIVLPFPYDPELALVHVEENGILGRAGFRRGDIAVHRHSSSVSTLCAALSAAEAGRPAEIVVINVADWAGGWARSRTLVVPAVSSAR